MCVCCGGSRWSERAHEAERDPMSDHVRLRSDHVRAGAASEPASPTPCAWTRQRVVEQRVVQGERESALVVSCSCNRTSTLLLSRKKNGKSKTPFHTAAKNMTTERHQESQERPREEHDGPPPDRQQYQELTPFAMALPMDLDKAKPAPTGPQMADPEDRYASTSHCRSPCCFL